ncbi:MAG: glycoside hydrolase family 65 protein [Erythrobacter sp.]|nr:glycoside hydrolase family 65 protein [Erythrobacter sp.]
MMPPLSSEDWLVRETAFAIDEVGTYETLFTVGNGYQGTRGSLAEGLVEELSGTYLAGVYDDHDANVIDQVNVQSWLPLSVRVEGAKLDANACRVVEHSRVLDLKTGLLHRDTVFEDKSGRQTRIRTIRLASMANQHLCGVQLEVTPINHSSEIEVSAGIDGDRHNLEALPSYDPPRPFPAATRWKKWAKSLHLEPLDAEASEAFCYNEARTISTGITIGVASSVSAPPEASFARAETDYKGVAQVFRLSAIEGESYTFDKLAAIVTTRDGKGEDVKSAATALAQDAAAQGFAACASASAAAWAKKWDDCDCMVTGDEEATNALRFNIYHLLIAANPNDPRANVGAKSMSGEGYRGHVFWDTEVFLLPFYIYAQPETAKALILYRYNTLPGALRNAKDNGFAGAQYPWESADSGIETTPKWTHDGVNRIWTGEEEIHITACVAYGVMTYVTATDDWDFMRDYGAEMLYQTSRFWISRLEHNESADRYELTRVIGPDEFHEHIDNNTFTNRMAQWHLDKAAEIFARLAKDAPAQHAALTERLGVSKAEVAEWSRVASKIYIPMDAEKNLVEQFEGYFALEDIPITRWDENHMPLYPEGHDHFSLNNSMLLKQPDVIMLIYMLPDEFSDEAKKANFEFYEKRTMHKSSLSPAIHAIMGIETGDYSSAHRYFERSAFVDLRNNQGNTADGMHIASAGGTWQSAVCGFGGFRVRNGEMTFNPWLPEDWRELTFSLQWRGSKLNVAIGHDTCRFQLESPSDSRETITLGDKRITLAGGVEQTVSLT